MIVRPLMIRAIKPRDAVEETLVIQMALVHQRSRTDFICEAQRRAGGTM